MLYSIFIFFFVKHGATKFYQNDGDGNSADRLLQINYCRFSLTFPFSLSSRLLKVQITASKKKSLFYSGLDPKWPCLKIHNETRSLTLFVISIGYSGLKSSHGPDEDK